MSDSPAYTAWLKWRQTNLGILTIAEVGETKGWRIFLAGWSACRHLAKNEERQPDRLQKGK